MCLDQLLQFSVPMEIAYPLINKIVLDKLKFFEEGMEKFGNCWRFC